MRKKRIAFLLVSALCFSLLPITAAAASSLSFELAAEAQSDDAVFVLGIKNNGEKSQAVGACQTVVQYDAAKLEPKATGTAPFKNNCYTTKDTTLDKEELSLNPTVRVSTPGKISIAFAGSDSYAIAPGETMTLLRINFQVKDTMTSGKTTVAFDAESPYAVFDEQCNPLDGITLGEGAVLTVQDAYRITDITVRNMSGTALGAIPMGECKVSVTLTNQHADGAGTVMIAAFNENGQFIRLVYKDFEGLDVGKETALPPITLDNTNGKVKALKVFVVNSFGDLTPLGDAVVFGK